MNLRKEYKEAIQFTSHQMQGHQRSEYKMPMC